MKNGSGKWKQLPSNNQNPSRFNQYEGSYKNDKKHGFGIFEWEAGNKYSGSYFNDEREGWGTMEWIDGSTFKGQWKEGI